MGFDRRVLAIGSAGAVAFFNVYTTQGLILPLQSEFGAGAADTGLTVSATLLAVAICAPLAGSISDRWGRRSVLVSSIFGLALATVACAASPSLWWLILWRFVQGVFIPGIFASAVAYINEEWTEVKRQGVTALYISSMGVGGLLGRVIAGVVTESLGWRAAFVLLGCIDVTMAMIVWRLMPPSRNFNRTEGVIGVLTGMALHLRNWPLMATCLFGFGLLFSQVATFTYSAVRLSESPFNLRTDQLSLIFLLLLVGIFVTPFTARSSYRFGRQRVVVVALAAGCGALLATLTTSLPAVLAGLAVSSAAVFVTQANASALVPELVQHCRSAAIGLYVCLYYLGGTVGAAIPGLLWDRFGWGGCVALTITAHVFIAGIAWVAWPRYHQMKAPVVAS